jgi:hypothetical protein
LAALLIRFLSNLHLHLLFIFLHLIASAISGLLVDPWPHESKSSNLYSYITFMAPSRGQFGHMSDLSDNQIYRSEELPEFVTAFKMSLSQKRRLDISASTSLAFCPVDDLICFAGC